MRLDGKRIFLTGAAQGIGRAIAEAALAEGASVCMTDRDGPLMQRTAAEIGACDGHASWDICDIADADTVTRAVEAATARMGSVNALINNAGINVFCDPLTMRDEDWQRCFDVNLKGHWSCCRAVLPGLLAAGGGTILNIASTHALTIIPGSFPYPLAKHALLGMTKALALEYAGQGVRVNALAPGYVETQKVRDYWQGFDDPEAARQRALDLHPGKRIATPQEIAAAAVFMISDECPFMNAACLTVDGGLSAQQHPA